MNDKATLHDFSQILFYSWKISPYMGKRCSRCTVCSLSGLLLKIRVPKQWPAQTSTAVIIKFDALFKQCLLSISSLALKAVQVKLLFKGCDCCFAIKFGSRIPFNRTDF